MLMYTKKSLLLTKWPVQGFICRQNLLQEKKLCKHFVTEQVLKITSSSILPVFLYNLFTNYEKLKVVLHFRSA